MTAERAKRRYACPDDCGLHCVIEASTVQEITTLPCPGGRGYMYGWRVLSRSDRKLIAEIWTFKGAAHDPQDLR